MDPVELIKKHPKEAEVLFLKWQELAEKYPELFSLETEDEISIWAKKHPEIDPSVLQEMLQGKSIQDAYYRLRDEDIQRQKDSQGSIDRSVTRADIPHVSRLESAYSKQPRIMEDDRNYQEITKSLKNLWLKNNPGKDLTSKEGIDYIYGSLGDDIAPSLAKDAEKIFQQNYPNKAKKDKEEGGMIYKNPQDDPRVMYLRKIVAQHARARKEHLGAPADIDQTIQNKTLQKFINEYPEKASVYTKGGNIVAPLQTTEKKDEQRKKALPERARDIYNLYKKSESAEKIGKTTGRLVEKTALNIGRTSGRFVFQGSRATIAGMRATAQGLMLVGRGVVAGAAAIGPIGWAVIGVIAAIIIIVFLIVLLVGGGGGGGSFPGFQTKVECVDPNNPSATIIVPDGNACAENAALFYTALEGIPITAVCRDKCTDFLGIVCDRDPATNTCAPPPASCGAPEAFCIEYAPISTSSGRLYDCSSASGSGYASLPNYPNCVASATPTPTPTP